MRKKTLCLCVLLMVGVAIAAVPVSPAYAVTYTGELESPTTIVGNGIWIVPGDVTLNWLITRDDDMVGPWTYRYTIAAPTAPITHWILELTPGVTFDDIFNITPGVEAQIRWFQADDPTTPGMPAAIYGIDFFNVNAISQTVSFQTYIDPVWGDFYARDGSLGGADNFAFSKNFIDPDPIEPPANGALDCKLLRPDRQAGPVIPEPSSVVLGLMGLAPILAARRFARRS